MGGGNKRRLRIWACACHRVATTQQAQHLRSMVVEDKARQSDVEEFFLQGVEDIKREAERLKRKTRLLPGQSETIDLREKEYEAALSVLFDSLFPERQGGNR